jgi:transcriptional regulator with XRE-family HTH domain
MGTFRQLPPSTELKVFSARIHKAIEFNKISIEVLAKNLNYKPDDIHRLLIGMREPGIKKLILLANSLGCSVDYLLGITPMPQRPTVVVNVDTDTLKPQLSGRERTSGQITGKEKPFLSMLSELPESDIELLMYIAGFLIERKEKGLDKILSTMNTKNKNDSVSGTPISPSNNKPTDDDFDEDSLWDGVEDDEFDDDDFDEDDLDYEEEDEEEDDDDFDDFDD